MSFQSLIIGYLTCLLVKLCPSCFIENRLGTFTILLRVMQWEHFYTSSNVVNSSEVPLDFAAFDPQKNPNKYCPTKILDSLLRDLLTELLFTLVVVHSDRTLCPWVAENKNKCFQASVLLQLGLEFHCLNVIQSA